MKTTIKIEVLGKSKGVYVSIGDHCIKTYDSFGKELYKVIRTAERYAERYIKKYYNDGGIIESYNEFSNLITREEY